MHGIRWILAAVVLSSPALAAAATRLLALPPVSEDASGERLTEIEGAIAAALSESGGVEVLRPDGPTFCGPSDAACIADAGRSRGVDAVLHVSARPVGSTISLLLSWIPVDGSEGRRAIEAVPLDASLADAVREQVVRLVALERYVGALVVDAAERSEIWVDGTLRGKVPLEEPIGDLRPGQHLLRVVRPGGAEARSYVEIRYRTITRVRIEPRSDEVSVVAYDGEVDLQPDTVAVEPEPGRGWRLARWTMLGAGAATIAAALVPALQAESDGEERDALRDAGGAFPEDVRSRERELRDDYLAGRTTAAVLLGAGAALLAGGGALWLLETLELEPFAPGGGTVEAGIGTDGAGAFVRWEF